MTQGLLYKTLKIYIVFSVIVLILSAPVFFVFTEKWHVSEADEALLLRLHEFEKDHTPQFKRSDIILWNSWNRDVKIMPTDTALTTHLFALEYFLNVMEDESEPYRVLRSPIYIEQKPYIFFARENLLEREDMVYNIVFLYLTLMVLLLLGLYLLTRYFSLRLWQPFYDLLVQLENFAINRPIALALPETQVDEFHRLYTAIDRLLHRNIIIYKSQKEFTENAAHELQTPLAVMQAKLENLMQIQNLSDNEAKSLESLGNAISRLIKLNKNLLLLTKIENNTYFDIQSISLKTCLLEQIDFHNEQDVFKDLILRVDIQEDIIVKISSALLEICLNNMLNNAVRHNVENGYIEISVKKGQLSIVNTGISTCLDQSKLFTRFSKVDPSSTGTGLGLAIVKRIVELQNWEVSYSYGDGVHAFSINF